MQDYKFPVFKKLGVSDSGNSGQLLLAPVDIKATTVSAYGIEVSWKDFSVLKLRGGVEGSAGENVVIKDAVEQLNVD